MYERLSRPSTGNSPSSSTVSPGKLPARVANINDAQRVYLAFGDPSGATTRGADPNNYLMVNTAYALSYNNSRGTPNWVAWRLTESDLGDVGRSGDFQPNEELPPMWNVVTPSDYSRSGYERGHICPSGDRSSDAEQNSLTFLMTNIAPQTDDLNAHVWEKLESYARGLVKRGHVDLFIIAGVYGENGRLKRKVTVPTNFWKIIVAVPEGGDLSSVNERSHVIAVDMPNIDGIAQDDWRKYRTTVRAIEQRTGYNFFSNLPQGLQDRLETKGEN